MQFHFERLDPEALVSEAAELVSRLDQEEANGELANDLRSAYEACKDDPWAGPLDNLTRLQVLVDDAQATLSRIDSAEQ